jgi:hypothetical protein
MSREDGFDKDLVPLEWFDHCLKPESFFDDDLLAEPVSGGGSAALTGQSETESQGTLTPNITIALVGIGVTESQGTLTPATSTNVQLTGQSETLSGGTLTPVFGVPLTGLLETDQSGALIPAFTVPLAGQSETESQGTVTPSTSTNVQLTGQSESVSAGILTPTFGIPLVGQPETDQTGTVTPTSGVAVQLTGQSEAISGGNLTPNFSLQLNNLLETLQQGIITPVAAAGAITQTFGNNTADSFAGTVDNGLNSPNPNTNQSGLTEIQATKYAPGAEEASAIMFTGLSAIPANAVITSARLFLTVTQQNLNNTINANRLLRVWDVATSTWNIAATADPWGTPGAQLDGTDRVAVPTGSVTLLDTVLGLTSIDVTSDVIGFVNGTLVNNGWLLERDSVGAFITGFTYFASSEGADGTRPYLSVTYTIPVIPPPVTVGLSGGFIPEQPRRVKRKEIREYVEAAIESFDEEIEGLSVPVNEIASLVDEIIKAIQDREFTQELYMAIVARDLVQQRIAQLLQDIEDEEDEFMLLG